LITDKTEIKEGVFKGHKFGKWGIESNDGINILPFEYDFVTEFIGGQAEVRKFGKSGVINLKGETVIPCNYDFIVPYMDGIALCFLKGIFKIECSPTFKPNLIKTIIDGISSFGVFLTIPSLSKRTNYGNNVIVVKGLLHISEINKANKRIDEFEKGYFLDLYIMKADEQKQRISFSFNPAVESKAISKYI